jgi:hypothetical protein
MMREVVYMKMLQELVGSAVLGATVGSTCLGVGVDGEDDRDEMWVCLPKREEILGFDTAEWTRVVRDQEEGVKSQPGDVDRVFHSLMKWMRLVVKGNPSVLMPLFIAEEKLLKCDVSGRMLRALVPSIVCRNFYYPFKGYMVSQWERLGGERGQMRVTRPELVGKFGYDTKYAYHVLRLGLQGVELLATGRMTLPMMRRDRELLMNVRLGKYTFKEFEELYLFVKEELDLALKGSNLPERPNMKVIEGVVMEINRGIVMEEVEEVK